MAHLSPPSSYAHALIGQGVGGWTAAIAASCENQNNRRQNGVGPAAIPQQPQQQQQQQQQQQRAFVPAVRHQMNTGQTANLFQQQPQGATQNNYSSGVNFSGNTTTHGPSSGISFASTFYTNSQVRRTRESIRTRYADETSHNPLGDALGSNYKTDYTSAFSYK